MEVKPIEQRCDRLQYIGHGQIPPNTHPMPNTEWDQEAALFLVVFFIQPSVGVEHVMIWSPDLGVMVKSIV